METAKMIDRRGYYLIGQIEDFPLHLGKTVQIGETEIAVFRTSDKGLFALENQTAHKKGGPLAEGLVSGEYVYCPLRDCKISLPTGEVQLPDTGHVRTFPIRLEGQAVFVGIR